MQGSSNIPQLPAHLPVPQRVRLHSCFEPCLTQRLTQTPLKSPGGVQVCRSSLMQSLPVQTARGSRRIALHTPHSDCTHQQRLIRSPDCK